MNRQALYHRINSEYAYLLDKDNIVIKLKASKGDLNKVILYHQCKFIYIREQKRGVKTQWEPVEMKKIASDDMYDYFEAVVKYEGISVNYFFELYSWDEIVRWGGDIFFSGDIPNLGFSFDTSSLSEADMFVVLEWMKNSVVYNLFPDRFARNDKVKTKRELKAWEYDVEGDTFLGGNFRGIMDKLDYLKELGISCLYLNPIFKSPTPHRYDIEDFYEISPELGTKEEFRELVKQAHKKGIKIVLDAVFNHTSDNFFAFKDLKEKGKKSKYKNWYYVDSYPLQNYDYHQLPNYRTFAYEYDMPKLNLPHAEVSKYILGVAEYWIKEFDIDGWRLDAADEVSRTFWRDFRRTVKNAKADAVIIGEVWYDATTWLQGDMFDSVMNYGFMGAMYSYFLENDSLESLKKNLLLQNAKYMRQPCSILWNLIGGHDTPRIFGDHRNSLARMKMIALLQMTFTGSPMIYYGDEVGMIGEEDPKNRQGMIWDEKKQNKELQNFYRKLINIRNSEKALTEGEVEFIHDEIVGYKRTLEDEEIVVYINRREFEYIQRFDGRYKDLLTGMILENEILIHKNSGAILKRV